jgi:hypothetical protein
MGVQQYDSAALKEYRHKAAQVAALRHELGNQIGQVEVSETQREFDKLTLSTQELYKFRAGLAPKDLFMATYNVTVINNHTVSLVIPKGCSRLQILEEAQRLVDGRDLICPAYLSRLQFQSSFTAESGRSEKICIDGHVEGLDAKNRWKQAQLATMRGLEMPAVEDLAVAFAVHWIATMQPLFGWYKDTSATVQDVTYLVRAWTGSLFFDRDGLDAVNVSDKYDVGSVAASARVYGGSRQSALVVPALVAKMEEF